MEFVRHIGKGGFGTVDLVKDVNGSYWARKTFSINQPVPLSPELESNVKKRFIREANIQSNINHHNIVRVVAAQLDHNPPYFFMPYAQSSLSDDLSADRTLNGRYLEAIMDILAGLEELHSLGIYHRDLKPQNVLRFGADEYRDYAIGDFGLMSIKDTQLSVLTTTGMRMGSDMYTAPEITADLKKASARSDIYSVGCILHDFVGTGDRIPCNEIDDDHSQYADIIRICTRRDPNRRFSSVSDLREALLSVDTIPAVPTSATVAKFVEMLASETRLDRMFWEGLVTFVEATPDSDDIRLIFNVLTIHRIDELCNFDEDLARRLSNRYSSWIDGSSFSFSSCDGLASRLVCFFHNLNELDSQVNILLALLYLGTSHNRWYVEREFEKLCGLQMNNNLATRLGLEIRVIGQDACRMFHHLERSIGTNLQNLHPTVYNTLRQVCNL
ncbi:TPA: serine/threonine-protein kinase [Vibrio cholerae]|uniref:serine/threonine-protein kinase n=1 Tax=Vibrio cholerae TaxID=666 RepID=UPI0015CF7DD2|nr:serine/threonine-protein kinase [Vibrio cholerae]HCG8095662.1 serine/threonine protein kinase [Vibrio parahaemolyticus]